MAPEADDDARTAQVERVADLLRFLAAYPAAVEAFLAAQPDLDVLREQLSEALETSGALEF